MSALKAIQVLKAREKVVKQNAYLRRYKHQELYQRTV